MKITGDDVEIIKATVTHDGTETDYTEELREAIKTRADAENSDSFETEQEGTGSTPPVELPNITTETSFEKNEDGTLYKITSHISYKYADILDAESAAFMESFGYDINSPVTIDTEVIYKRVGD